MDWLWNDPVGFLVFLLGIAAGLYLISWIAVGVRARFSKEDT